MPTISEASLTRKFNLGNYESLEVGAKAFMAEGENLQQVLAQLEYQLEKYFEAAHPEAFTRQPQPSQPIQQPQAVQRGLTKEDAEKLFPDELCELLSFEDKGDYIIIKPRQFLGAENFAKIAQIVREVGGDYVSAGKESHFRIPKKKV